MASDIEIKVYIVCDGAGRIVGVKLNRASADNLALCHPKGYHIPMVADKK